MQVFQVFFYSPKGKTITKMLSNTFTLDDFVKAAGDVLGSRSDEETLSWRYAVSNKSLNVNNAKEFDSQKHLITKDCNIFVLGRLLGGSTFQDTLQTIVEQQLKDELDKVDTQSSDCSICLDSETDCLRVCCVWMCREDFKSWVLDKQFKVSCMLCSKAVMLRDIFKTPEYIATVQALEDERQLLQNMDCQRCLECNALLHNETMYSRQTCVICHRVFCFFCNRKWNAAIMQDRQNTCGEDCVYETMLSFQPVPFHYKTFMKIPSQRTCPRCFNFGLYDGKCKYHACQVCKFNFCFLCLESEEECKRKHKSRYDHCCVQTPVSQNYSMFPRLTSL